MKFNIIIPLIILMTGVSLPTNIAEAASSTTPEKSEKVTYAEQSGENNSLGGSSKTALSQKTIKIKFFLALGLISSSLLLPELFYKPKNQAQNKSQNDHQPLKSNKVDATSENLQPLDFLTNESKKVNNEKNSDSAKKEHTAI